MYSRVLIHTRLSAAEAEAIVQSLVQPKRFVLDPDPVPPDPRPFAGHVEAGRFKIRRVIRGRNDFLPVITGRVSPTEDGATVQVQMRLTHAVALLVGVMVTLLIAGLARELPDIIHERSILNLTLALYIPTFLICLTVFSYYPEKRKAERMLRAAFDAPPDPVQR